MAHAKVTFTLDRTTVARLRQAAARLGKAQSQVVREAVRDYAERVGRLSEPERLRALQLLDVIEKRAPARTASAVDSELRAVRAARRHGGRRRAAS